MEGTPVSVAITTLGCKSNQYDSSAMEELLTGRGLRPVPFPGPADTYIINTCTVTARTDSQSRALIRRARRANPEAVVIVTGCYAQVSPGDISDISGVDYILGNPEKEEILRYIARGRNHGSPEIAVSPGKAATPLTLRAQAASGRTRVNLKIQDGCNRRCSYCIIPRARGASRSAALEDLAREIDLLCEKGFKEIILTGIHIGAYGADLEPERDLASILRLIEKKAWPARFRISSLDPDEVTEEFVDILKSSKRICNHLHIPLQSGDDRILRRMNRGYTAAEFYRKAALLQSSIKDISIGSDVIAGFPGEGPDEFENSYALLKDAPVNYFHIFPFSARAGTPASGFGETIPSPALKERCGRLRGLDALKRVEFYKRFLLTEATVLVEGAVDKKTGLLKGKARNYIPVFLDAPGRIQGTGFNNSFLRVRLKALFGERGMTGEAV